DAVAECPDLHGVAHVDVAVGARRSAALHVDLLALEAVELRALLGGELLGALARVAAGLLDLRGAPRFEIFNRPFDLAACGEQILSRLLPRLALRIALALANGALASAEVGGAAAGVFGHLRELELARRERLRPRL